MAAAFQISKHEKLAVLLAGASLSAGFVLAWWSAPIWLNRAGSVVIVIGVLLAASRLADISEANVEKLISDNFDKGMAGVILNIEKTHNHILDNDQREALRKGVYTSITEGFAGLFEDWRRRVKRYEASLVPESVKPTPP